MDSRKDTSPQPAAPEKCKTLSVLLAYRAPHLREVLQRPRKVIQGWGRVGWGGPGWAVNPTLAVTLAAAVRCLIHCATAGTPERKFLSKEFSVFGGTASLTSRAGSMFLEDPRVPWSCLPGPGGPSGRAASQWGMACRTPEAGGRASVGQSQTRAWVSGTSDPPRLLGSSQSRAPLSASAFQASSLRGLTRRLTHRPQGRSDLAFSVVTWNRTC